MYRSHLRRYQQPQAFSNQCGPDESARRFVILTCAPLAATKNTETLNREAGPSAESAGAIPARIQAGGPPFSFGCQLSQLLSHPRRVDWRVYHRRHQLQCRCHLRSLSSIIHKVGRACVVFIPCELISSSTTASHNMSTSLDQLKATGTTVVSDSGDFESKRGR